MYISIPKPLNLSGWAINSILESIPQFLYKIATKSPIQILRTSVHEISNLKSRCFWFILIGREKLGDVPEIWMNQSEDNLLKFDIIQIHGRTYQFMPSIIYQTPIKMKGRYLQRTIVLFFYSFWSIIMR